MSSKNQYLVIAKIVAVRGLKGQVKAKIITDFPERFALLKNVYIGEELVPYFVDKTSVVENMVYIKFKGCDSVEKATALIGKNVFVSKEDAIKLPEDWYFWDDILGMKVFTTDNQYIGIVSEILDLPANHVYIVQADSGEVLIPAIEDVIKSIDINNSIMIIQPIAGLLD